jgi:hypothetical protein
MPCGIKVESVASTDFGSLSTMAGNVHLRFLGVFQPGTQISQDFARLTCRASFSGFHGFAQLCHHLTDGAQFTRNGIALDLKRVTFFLCSDQYHSNLCLLC